MARRVFLVINFRHARHREGLRRAPESSAARVRSGGCAGAGGEAERRGGAGGGQGRGLQAGERGEKRRWRGRRQYETRSPYE